VLNISIGLGNTAMLPQVFGPRFDHEPFEHLPLVGNVLGDAPTVGAISSEFV
jgi:hypothetical protein